MDPSSAAAAHYNVEAYYRDINSDARRAYAGTQLRVGMLAPPLRLPDVDGHLTDLREVCARSNALIVFGCHSAPPCRRELPHIDRMAAEHAPDVQALFVYTREIHPNEQLPYGRFEHHRTTAAKTAAARDLRLALGLRMTVLVDDLAGTTHRAYGGLPFCAVVVDRDGVLLHRAEWASAEQLTQVLHNVRLADRRRADGHVPRRSLSETLWAMERLDKKP